MLLLIKTKGRANICQSAVTVDRVACSTRAVKGVSAKTRLSFMENVFLICSFETKKLASKVAATLHI